VYGFFKKPMQEQETCKKCMDFFARRKNPCKSVWIYSPIAKNMQKLHVFFLPDKKTHARAKNMQKVHGFFRPT
jgi:hypothetical protein